MKQRFEDFKNGNIDMLNLSPLVYSEENVMLTVRQLSKGKGKMTKGPDGSNYDTIAKMNFICRDEDKMHELFCFYKKEKGDGKLMSKDKNRFRLTTLVIIIGMLVNILMPISVYAAVGEAENDPILISTADQIDSIRNNLTGYYKLTADIDLSGNNNFVPIGNSANKFKGHIDGNGHTISNLKIDQSTVINSCTGLIGYLDQNGSLKNIILVNVDVKGYGQTGALIGINDGNVENCSASGQVSGMNGKIGGLIGACGSSTVGGTIINCHSTAAVKGGSCVGGFIGDNQNGAFKIQQCYAEGEVIGAAGGALGGFAGNLAGNISDCYAKGKVTAQSIGSYGVGGFVGQTNTKIQRSYSVGAVSSSPSPFAGGFAGAVDGGNRPDTCYYNNQTALVAYNGMGVGESTNQMKVLPSSWAETGFWAVDPLKNDGYPYLLIMTDDGAIPKAKAALDETKFIYSKGESKTSVKTNFTMPLIGLGGTTIVWTEKTDSGNNISINPATGVVTVTRPSSGAGDKTVTVTATISKGSGIPVTKDLSVVIKENIPVAATVTTLVASGLKNPYGVAVDSTGNVYIADTNNSAVKKRDTAGIVTTLISSGISCPTGITVDSTGNLYIAGYANNIIKKRDTAGTVTTLVDSGLYAPSGVAVDSKGNVYISDMCNNAIKKRDTAGTVTTLINSGLKHPYEIVLDSAENLYIADRDNASIKKRDASGNVTTLVSSGLNAPYGVAVDSAGNVYISDYGADVIKKKDTLGNLITLIDAGLNGPTGIALDSTGNLYIADTLNNAIKKVTFLNSSISSSVTNFDKNASSISNASITVELNLNGNALSGIKNGTTVLAKGKDYTITGNSVTIDKSYLNTLATGTATFNFIFTAGADQSLSIEVSESIPSTITAGKGLGRVVAEKPQYANVKIPFIIDAYSFSKKLTSYSFDITYDPAKVGTVTVDNFNGLAKPIVGAPVADGSKENVTVTWDGTFTGDLDAIYNSSKGVLFKLNFVIKSAFTPGETPIEVGICSFAFSSGTSSNGSGINGKIISGIVYGDINGDGAITSLDAALINKYVAGKTTAISGEAKQIAADVNEDGSITAADIIEITNYILGNDSTLKTLFGY